MKIDENTLRAHNQALSAKNLELLEVIRTLAAGIDKLALTPAPDFYKPGDHAAGLVNDLWIAKNEAVKNVLFGEQVAPAKPLTQAA